VEDELAVKIFNLIRAKDDANAEAYVDDEDAIDRFRACRPGYGVGRQQYMMYFRRKLDGRTRLFPRQKKR
jgi:hypothetical protein